MPTLGKSPLSHARMTATLKHPSILIHQGTDNNQGIRLTEAENPFYLTTSSRDLAFDYRLPPSSSHDNVTSRVLLHDEKLS